jgi:hypothetical protein
LSEAQRQENEGILRKAAEENVAHAERWAQEWERRKQQWNALREPSSTGVYHTDLSGI